MNAASRIPHPSTNGRASKSQPRRKAPQGERKPRPLGRQDRLTVAIAGIAAGTTVVTSMSLNVWAFTHVIGSSLGVAVGLLVPVWVLALTYLGQRSHRSRWLMGSCYALAAFVLAVSLHHLADGYTTILPAWEGWAMAVVTDLLQVAAKVVIIRTLRR